MTTSLPPAGRLAGIDYGTVRIGVAVTDPERRLASPHSCWTRRDAFQDARWFRQLASDERLTGFVVGLPIHTDGRESQKSREARKFGAWLGEQTGLPVVFFDERFTTSAANELMSAAGLTSQRQKERRDMLAAQILLTAFLEAGARPTEVPEALDDHL